MYTSPDFGKAEFESVHTLICGAASAGKSLIQGLLRKAGKDIFFQEGYGMTEITTISHLTRVKTKNNKIGSIGHIVHGTKCKVVHPDTQASLPNNTAGELWVQGPQVMKGYYKNETATKEMVDAEGWLKTGDVVMYDEDKSFFIIDRMKELIKVKGLQVSPSELEDLLRTSKDVIDVAVIGVPHEKFGEAPRAFIVRRNEKLTVGKVHDFLERKIASHKKLSGGVEFVQAVPRSAAGKILRRVILEHYKNTNSTTS